MKKFFLGVFAIAGLVACVQSEEFEAQTSVDNQIAFGGYVGNAVRKAEDPSTKVQDLNNFTVWAYIQNPQATEVGNVFDGVAVTNPGNGWTYDGPRYWMEGYAYRFFAITPYGNGGGVTLAGNESLVEPFTNGLGKINFTNANGTEDVLYASYAKAANEATPDKVTFNFNHILSKVKFSFKNQFDDASATVKVKEVKMVVPAKGYVTLNPANEIDTPAADRVKYNWTPDGTETLTLNFGDVEGGAVLPVSDEFYEVDYERLTIPTLPTHEYKITFKVEINYQNLLIEKDFESTLTDYEFVSGTAYNLITTITPDILKAEKIEFDAQIIDWYKPTPEDHDLGYYKDVNSNTYVVTSGNGLKNIAAEINAGVATDRNIVLSEDIDLNATRAAAASNWTPIGTQANPFKGTFDGKGFKVSNLVIDGGSSSNIGFFGFTINGEIKNLVIENAKVSGRLNVGVVAGTPYTSKYSNITVTGHVEVDGMAYVGAVGGKNAYASWDNIVVNVDETSYVNANSVENGTAYRTYVGGVIGFCGEGGHSFSNIYSNINVKGSTCDVGGIVGIAHYGNNFVNCVCEGDVEIYNASEEADAQEIGGLAGVWNNTNGTKVTFTNCQFTGELKANNGYVINTNKFGNLVCAAYGAGTGVLVIDGNEYTLVDGKVVVNGCTSVSTAEELTKVLSEGGSVFLQENIDIKKLDLQNLTADVVIDANGNTITTASNYGVQVKAGKNITLKNAKVEMTVAGDYITYAAGLKIENGDYQGKTITLKNCEIRMCNTDWAYAVNMPASVKNLNLVIDGCTLEGALALQCWGDNNTITVTNSNLICNYTTSSMYTSYCVALQGDGSNNSENNTLNISGCAFSYSGVDNFNSTIKAVYNHKYNGANTITVDNCTYGEKVKAY